MGCKLTESLWYNLGPAHPFLVLNPKSYGHHLFCGSTAFIRKEDWDGGGVPPCHVTCFGCHFSLLAPVASPSTLTSQQVSGQTYRDIPHKKGHFHMKADKENTEINIPQDPSFPVYKPARFPFSCVKEV